MAYRWLTLIFLLCAVPAHATSYFIAPAGAGGSDSNNGLSSGAPWLTPNHALNCGDVISAAAGTYDEANFRPGQWGVVTCPANNNVAWLKCSTFDTCKINIAIAGHDAMTPTRSYWGIQGWEVTASTVSTNQCFEAYPPDNTTSISHIIFANNIANGCGDGAFTTGSVYGVSAPTAGVDYVAFLGNIAYNGAQDNAHCYSGIDVVAPFNTDTLPGTHYLIDGNFAFDNVDPTTCEGHASTDGEGVSFDTVNDPTNHYTYQSQMVAEDNISVFNGGYGIQAFDNYNLSGPPNAPIIIKNNTTYGNQTATINANPCSEISVNFSLSTQVYQNLAQAAVATACLAAVPLNVLSLVSGDATDQLTNNFIFSAAGHNTTCNPGASCSSNLSGDSAAFANPVNPPAPSCSGKTNTVDCMSTVIANYTPTFANAKNYGRRAPGASSFDPLFPQWLCSVTNMPAGLITMGCAVAGSTSYYYVNGRSATYYVDNSGSPACSDSNAGTTPAAPWCTVAHVAAIQASTLRADNQVLFKCGDTWNEQFDLAGIHGTAAHPIVLGHYGANCALPTNTASDYTPGNVVLPTLNGGSSRAYGFDAINTSVSYLTIDGFNIHDVTQSAINFETSSGAMPGIVIKNNLVHQDGPGACGGCGSPSDPGPYDTTGQVVFEDFTQGQDGVKYLNNTVWDTGGHNSMRVHFDTSTSTLVDHNLVGPGCIHNCIDTKGIKGTVSNNIATCPTATARGLQCLSPGANAGFYTENPFVVAGTSGKWIGNVAHDIPICYQLRGNDPDPVTPTLYNNTCYNATTQGWDLSTTTSADVQKNIVGGSVGTGGIGTWDYNDNFGASGNPTGAHDINVDPAYVNPSTFDFHPTNSTVATAGAPDTVTPFAYLGALPPGSFTLPTVTNPGRLMNSNEVGPAAAPAFLTSVTFNNPQNPVGVSGCTNTGSADCTAAFQAGVNAGDLHIPAGTYLANGTVNVPSGSGTGGGPGLAGWNTAYKNIVCDPGVTIKRTTAASRGTFTWPATNYGKIIGCGFLNTINSGNPMPYASGNAAGEFSYAILVGGPGIRVWAIANTFTNFPGDGATWTFQNDSRDLPAGCGPGAGCTGGTIGDGFNELYNLYTNCGAAGPVRDDGVYDIIAFNQMTQCGMDIEVDPGQPDISFSHEVAYNIVTALPNRHAGCAVTLPLLPEVFSTGSTLPGNGFYRPGPTWYNSISTTGIQCNQVPGDWVGNVMTNTQLCSRPALSYSGSQACQ